MMHKGSKNPIVKSLPAKVKMSFEALDREFLFKFSVIIVLIGIFTYKDSIDFSFTNWDDEQMVVNNPQVQRPISPGSIFDIFTSFHHSHYHPLVVISYSIEYWLFNNNPAPYHATNVIFHLLNSILVLFVFYKLSRDKIIAAVVSLLFVAHPIHVESVAWIAERKDMLYSFFYLAALLSYIYYLANGKRKFIIWVYVLFILSCLSKASAVTLPVVLLLIDYYYEKTFNLKQLKSKALFFLISLVFGLINVAAQYRETFKGSELEIPDAGFLERVLFAFYNMWFYVYKAIIPVDLSAFYAYPDIQNSGLPIIYYIAPFFTAAMLFLALRAAKFENRITFGILFAVTVLPLIQIVPVGRSISADRFVYLPILGLFFLIAVGSSFHFRNHLKTKFLKTAAIYSFVILVIVLGYLSYKQSQIWSNSITLYSDMIRKNPRTPIAYNNRGAIYLKANNNSAAETDFLNAIKYDPRYASAYNNMGLLHHNRKEYDEAVVYFNKAISINPNFSEAYFNMGHSYLQKGEIEDAIDLYKKAVEIDPNFAAAYNNLGKVYGASGRTEEAIIYFLKAIESNPNYAVAEYNLAVAYLKKGESNLGIEHMKRAASLGNTSAIDFLIQSKINR